jgi:hypothetical protein
MEFIIIFGAVNVMIWTSILLYRMAINCLKDKNEVELEILPPYDEPPPPYTPRNDENEE